MKSISEKAEPSHIYTNHCIRHSVVDTLDENNFESHHIMAHTGNKSESSKHQYATKCPLKKRREMAECLASNLDRNVHNQHQEELLQRLVFLLKMLMYNQLTLYHELDK